MQRTTAARRRARWLGLAAALPWTAAVAAQGVAGCVMEADNQLRLACYDRLFREPKTGAPADQPLPTTPVEPAQPADRPEALLASSVFTKSWELTREAKRGTFVVRTYLPNFILPLHASSSINRTPSSPTRGVTTGRPDYKPLEAKLQISLRTKVAEGLVLPDADLWFAFTQRSLWQVWNRQESSPFRSTDYQPEAIYVIPVPPRLGDLPGGWNWRMAQLGIAHQSNGQAGSLSRSWNRVYASAAFDHGEFGLVLRGFRRIGEKTNDDNPDMSRHIGNAEVMASWLPGRATASLTWRTHPRALDRGSLQFDWTYPVIATQPAGLRWYAQVFTGYGETLLDYNHRQTSVGLGLTLFQF